MGYTHYAYRPKKLPAHRFRCAVNDCKLVCDYLVRTKGLVLWHEYHEPGSKPEFTKDVVYFNGAGEDGHETFMVEREYAPEHWQEPKRGLYFTFCKTARKPYDTAVCACLIVFNHYFGEKFQVASDASDEQEEGWPIARAACQELFGYGGDFSLNKDDIGRLSLTHGMPAETRLYKTPVATSRLYVFANGWVASKFEARSWAADRLRATGEIPWKHRVFVFEGEWQANQLHAPGIVMTATRPGHGPLGGHLQMAPRDVR
jgi:hypothetical protein